MFLQQIFGGGGGWKNHNVALLQIENSLISIMYKQELTSSSNMHTTEKGTKMHGWKNRDFG